MAIEYKTVTYRTVESANDNATYCWVELSAAHVPAVNGLIKRIVIQGATTSASGMTTDPMYLGLWERQDDGGLISLGCSKNAVTQAINQQSVWEFDGAIIRGKSLLLGLLSSPDEHWTNNTQLLLRSRVQTNDTDGCVILTNIGRIRVTPDITFTVDVPEYVPDDEPEPEPESEEHRIVDISKYWIQIIRNTNEFKQIAIAENPEFNGLLDAIYRALKDGFILEATDYGVSRWEKILGLVVTEGMSLEDRKVQILTHLSVKLPYTWRVLKQMLTEYLGEGNFRMSIDNDTQTLHMSLTAGAMSKTADIDQLLKRVLPENLVIEYDDFPMDYTLLEYLESSGTQYIDTGIVTDGTYTITARMQLFSSSKDVWGRRSNNGNAEGNAQPYGNSVLNTYDETKVAINYVWRGYNRNSPFDLKQPHDYVVAEGQKAFIVDGVSQTVSALNSWAVKANNVDSISHFLFWSNVSNSVTRLGKALASIYAFSMQDGASNTVLDFVPVLDANGTPCMYDTVSKTCFYNKGTGTFGYRIKGADNAVMPLDLDDPYYVAPSGVWAKLIDENTLDIITALDPTVDESQGYKLFANAGEAYQYFNIKEVNEND